MPYQVQFGNILYLIPWILLIVTCFFLVRLCRKKGEKFADKLIFWLCMGNFILHFAKQLMPGYAFSDWPFSLRQSTPENLCALLITFSPFMYKWGGTHMKDYLMSVGLASGLLVFAYPTTALTTPLIDFVSVFEVGRFYLCHAVLIIVGVLIALNGFHKFSYKRIPFLAVYFLAAQAIIVINEALLWSSGIVQYDWSYFFSRDVRNASLSFGPQSSMDGVLGCLYWMCGIQWDNNSVHYFVPILWMIVPLFVFGCPLIFLITLPFTYREVRSDRMYFSQRLRMRSLERIKKKQNATKGGR